MILDKRTTMSDAQTVTTGSENGVQGTYSIPLTVARDIGASDDLYVVVQVQTAMAGTNPNATTVLLETDDNLGLNSPVTVMTIGIIPTNSVAGTRLIQKLPPVDTGASNAYQTFLGVRYTSANALSAAAFNAFICNGVDLQRYYANAFDIATS